MNNLNYATADALHELPIRLDFFFDNKNLKKKSHHIKKKR